MVAAPWLHPCAGAFFKVCDNPISYAGVNVLAVKAALGVFVFRCHWFLLSFENGLQRTHATLPLGESRGVAKSQKTSEEDSSVFFGGDPLGGAEKATIFRCFFLDTRGTSGPLAPVFNSAFRERDRYPNGPRHRLWWLGERAEAIARGRE